MLVNFWVVVGSELPFCQRCFVEILNKRGGAGIFQSIHTNIAHIFKFAYMQSYFDMLDKLALSISLLTLSCFVDLFFGEIQKCIEISTGFGFLSNGYDSLFDQLDRWHLDLYLPIREKVIALLAYIQFNHLPASLPPFVLPRKKTYPSRSSGSLGGSIFGPVGFGKSRWKFRSKICLDICFWYFICPKRVFKKATRVYFINNSRGQRFLQWSGLIGKSIVLPCCATRCHRHP